MGFYKTAQKIVRPLSRVLFRLRGENVGLVPAEGPAVLCSNHKTNLDPLFLGIVIDRPLFFMAKEELFHVPVLAPLIKALGAFPVRRGKADAAAMRYALRLLDKGEVIAMFPEGTRQKHGNVPGRFKSGAARIAFEKKCPVVPAAVVRSGKGGIFRHKIVRVGKPIPYTQLGFTDGGVEDMRRAGELIRTRVIELLGVQDTQK